MLINLTNHPYLEWGEDQKEAAAKYGYCVDLPFPNVDPDVDETYIKDLSDIYAERILRMKGNEEITVHIMGEQTFCYFLISKLSRYAIPCIASCSSRDVKVRRDGTKVVRFHFVKFRKYNISN